MGGFPKAFLALAIALSLAISISACGGDDSTTTSSVTTPGAQAKSPSPSSGEGERGSKGSAGRSGGDGQGRGGGEVKESGDGEDSATADIPTHYKDSGGGAHQFRTKGHENQVPDFGEEAPSSERDEAAKVLLGYLAARADEDWEKACSYLSASHLKQIEEAASEYEGLESDDCPAVLPEMFAELPEGREPKWTKADVGSLRIKGDKALILFHGPEETDYFMAMAREDGGWKIALALPLPVS